MTRAAEIVRELEADRARRNITYYAVAKAAKESGMPGASPIGVQRVLTGETQPQFATVVAIAAALGRRVVVTPYPARGKKKSEKSGNLA